MFVPIFTSFGIETSSQHSGRPRTFLALISLLKLFFILFCDPHVSTRGIASILNWTLRNKLQWNLNRNSSIFIQENAFENVVWKMAAILSRPQCVKRAAQVDATVGTRQLVNLYHIRTRVAPSGTTWKCTNQLTTLQFTSNQSLFDILLFFERSDNVIFKKMAEILIIAHYLSIFVDNIDDFSSAMVEK